MLANECRIELRSGCNTVNEGHDTVDDGSPSWSTMGPSHVLRLSR